MTSSPSSVDVAFQDIHRLEQQTSSLSHQMARVLRLIDLDEKEKRVERGEELIQNIKMNTTLMNRLLEEIQQKRKQENEEEYTSAFYEREQNKRDNAKKERTNRDRALMTLPRRKIQSCPIEGHEHKGVVFIGKDEEENEVIVETLCPIHLHIKLSKLAFEDGELKKFNEKYPLEEFLKHYSNK